MGEPVCGESKCPWLGEPYNVCCFHALKETSSHLDLSSSSKVNKARFVV